jgi:hypothetical protein
LVLKRAGEAALDDNQREQTDMTNVNVKKTLDVPAAAVWETISQFNGIENYLGMVARSEVEGEGIGARRTCTLQDGAVIRERLAELSDAERKLVYEITESPLPVQGYRSTMQVRDTGDGRCEVEWSSEFEVLEGPSEPFEQLFMGAYADGCAGLEKMHQR